MRMRDAHQSKPAKERGGQEKNALATMRRRLAHGDRLVSIIPSVCVSPDR